MFMVPLSTDFKSAILRGPTVMLSSRGISPRIGIGDHDLCVCSGIQFTEIRAGTGESKVLPFTFQDGGGPLLDVDIERGQAAGGVSRLELICACLWTVRRKRNGVLVAGTVVSYVGSTRAETAPADAWPCPELCRLRLVRGEIRSDRTSVTGDDDAIEIRGVGSGIDRR